MSPVGFIFVISALIVAITCSDAGRPPEVAAFMRLRGFFGEVGESIRIFKSKSVIECAATCLQTKTCVSFNVIEERSNGERSCDLRDQELTSAEQLIYQKSADYFGPPIKCRDGWIQNGVSCYWLANEEKQWEQAKDRCDDLASHLITFSSWHEHLYFVGTLAPTYVRPVSSESRIWIGSSWSESYFMLGSGSFRWIDSKEALNASWPVWASAPTDTDDGECLSVIVGSGETASHGKYTDDNCDCKHNFFCEYELL